MYRSAARAFQAEPCLTDGNHVGSPEAGGRIPGNRPARPCPLYGCIYVHTIMRMRFEWDEAKRATNLAKHGVDFADAVGVFYDECALTREDADAEGEQRFVTLGMGFVGRLLVVVYTERKSDTIRIISARKASRGEREAYEG